MRTWCSYSGVPCIYMRRGYHSLPNAGTLYTPQWMKMPNFASRYHRGGAYCESDAQLSLNLPF